MKHKSKLNSLTKNEIANELNEIVSCVNSLRRIKFTFEEFKSMKDFSLCVLSIKDNVERIFDDMNTNEEVK